MPIFNVIAERPYRVWYSEEFTVKADSPAQARQRIIDGHESVELKTTQVLHHTEESSDVYIPRVVTNSKGKRVWDDDSDFYPEKDDPPVVKPDQKPLF